MWAMKRRDLINQIAPLFFVFSGVYLKPISRTFERKIRDYEKKLQKTWPKMFNMVHIWV